MAQTPILPDASTLLRHKLPPSLGEGGHFYPAMIFNTQAQAEPLHIAAWPYTPVEADPFAAYWESFEVNLAATRLYAVNAGAPLVFASIPIMYHSLNTTGLAKTVPYTSDGEQSWGVLQEMVAGFPSYIPKVVGALVPHRVFPVAGLIAATKSS
ncbi:hypothetical protein EK21DRAFT_98239 [Setomelanomma holmii]|uniref:Uncharacterized protein n=1 Tax=Setomelanomma holmii TaxID=210430 RepID=A0A9P4HEU4_9PLEO|nr:hypothetical protein EK21DRAFT_98239 [Setomelanomma holmii]